MVSKDTIEEDVLEKARRKMILEYAIISLGVTAKSDQPKAKDAPSTNELSEILKFGASTMFRSNDNQKKLETLDLDDVLEHAEDHDTTGEAGGASMGGEDFLKQFEVTDYKADVTWDDIIPAEDRAKAQAEEKERQEQQLLKDQRDEALGRNRRPAGPTNEFIDRLPSERKAPVKRASVPLKFLARRGFDRWCIERIRTRRALCHRRRRRPRWGQQRPAAAPRP